MTRWRADLLLLFTALVWGAAFVGQATAMEHMGPLSFTGLRFLLAMLAVLPFAVLESKREAPLMRAHIVPMIILGVVFFLAGAIQQVGLTVTSVTNAGFLTALYVVLVPAVAFIALRAKLPFIVWPAAGLSLSGTWALGGGLDGLNWGDGIMLISALFWAIQMLLIGALATRSGRPVTMAAIQFGVTAILGLVAGFIFETPSLIGAVAAWKELAFTGFISGGLAFTLQMVAQRYTPPSDAAIIMSGEALFAALFGALLLGERLAPLGWLGCGLILIAVIMVQLAPIWRR